MGLWSCSSFTLLASSSSGSVVGLEWGKVHFSELQGGLGDMVDVSSCAAVDKCETLQGHGLDNTHFSGIMVQDMAVVESFA